MIDNEGAEISSYTYDAWANFMDTVCYEGYETAYNLNHITYRGEESGLYYLQCRCYDSKMGDL